MFLVSGESLRYTARDMEVIRQEARLNAEGSKDEVERLKIVCRGYEEIIKHMQEIHEKQLLKKVSEFPDLESFIKLSEGSRTGTSNRRARRIARGFDHTG